jgi:hypothetical protein
MLGTAGGGVRSQESGVAVSGTNPVCDYGRRNSISFPNGNAILFHGGGMVTNNAGGVISGIGGTFFEFWLAIDSNGQSDNGKNNSIRIKIENG